MFPYVSKEYAWFSLSLCNNIVQWSEIGNKGARATQQEKCMKYIG